MLHKNQKDDFGERDFLLENINTIVKEFVECVVSILLRFNVVHHARQILYDYNPSFLHIGKIHVHYNLH